MTTELRTASAMPRTGGDLTSPEFSATPELRRDHLGPQALLFPC